VATVTFEQARRCVIETVPCAGLAPPDSVSLDEACGRVLARAVAADRDFPALPRSIRDGFAVRSQDTPGRLRLAGEVRAGQFFDGELEGGQAVEIMTGAPVPAGADAVVMIEHVARDGEFVTVPAAEPGQFVNPQAAEARAGETVISEGRRLGIAEIALLAATGHALVPVYRRPRAAILSTGDEIVELDAQPAPCQVRNSNAHALAAQVRRAGGLPVVLPIAPDTDEATRRLLGRALDADLVLISGGVSAGKYDVVEPVLSELGAEFFFDRVLIQPGQPLVFGRAAGKYFFGLPGNPVSTLVTFELFARAALDRLQGIAEPPLPLMPARLATAFRHKPGLTRFLPARLSADGAEVAPVPWRGSSDLAAVARGNAFLVAEANRDSWAAGDFIRVLLR
jgi:molybdopterin molybdotransferase